MSDVSKRPYSTIDISSEAFWSKSVRERDESFAALRAEAGLTWHPKAYGSLMDDPTDPGFWAAARHADIQEVSKNAAVYSSAPNLGGVMFENAPEDLLRETQSILTMDDPEHARTRAMVASAFSPRQIRQVAEQVQQQAITIVDELLEHGPGDFVELVAKRLPLWTNSEMLGVPEDQRERLVKAVDDMIGYNDPEYIGEGGDPFTCLLTGTAELHGIAQDLIDARRSKPTDDLMSELIKAEVDGVGLTDDELRSYFCLLTIAGNDTTRNTTSHGILALTENPEQFTHLRENFDRAIPLATEEFLRWGTPVMTFRRTALHDTVLAGQEIKQGEKVVMFYSSGNRDESVFADPWKFDISRSPNPHISFGGGGVHTCLGQHIGRMQLKSIFGQLITRVPDLKLGEPDYVVGHFTNAVKHMPISF